MACLDQSREPWLDTKRSLRKARCSEVQDTVSQQEKRVSKAGEAGEVVPSELLELCVCGRCRAMARARFILIQSYA